MFLSQNSVYPSIPKHYETLLSPSLVVFFCYRLPIQIIWYALPTKYIAHNFVFAVVTKLCDSLHTSSA